MHKSRWADPQPDPTSITAPTPREATRPETEAQPQHASAIGEDRSHTEEAKDPTEVTASEEVHNASAVTDSHQVEAPSEEGFAQTGAQQDDLFDDFVPAEESMRIRSDDDLFNDDFTPMDEPIVEPEPPQQPPLETRSIDQPSTQTPDPVITKHDPQRPRGEGTSHRSRANRHPRSGRNGNPRANNTAINNTTPSTSDTPTTPTTPTTAAAPDNAPTGPRLPTTPSVRGDRHATGGVRKPKLTEEELAAKLASMNAKNASLTAAHARAEADAASFAAREVAAAEAAATRRKEERRDRQIMMGEREKNRERKLKAHGGREWDMAKEDLEGTDGRRRGVGGERKEEDDGREYLWREGRGGRGGAGRGGGRGTGRMGGQQHQGVPKKEEFPALPSEKVQSTVKMNVLSVRDLSGNGTTVGKSWAEQMDSSNGA